MFSECVFMCLLFLGLCCLSEPTNLSFRIISDCDYAWGLFGQCEALIRFQFDTLPNPIVLSIHCIVARHDGFVAPHAASCKGESMMGYTIEQLHRDKALKTMGATEEKISEEHHKKLAALGHK